MKPLYRIGKYHNLEKLDKIAKYVQNFAQLQPIAGSVDSPFNWLSEYDDGIFFTLSVGWHVDYIDENRKWSTILVIASDKHDLYASTETMDSISASNKTDEEIDYILDQKTNNKRLTLKTGDILLLDTVRFHKLENHRKSNSPFIFLTLNTDFFPGAESSVKCVNYLVYDYLRIIKSEEQSYEA